MTTRASLLPGLPDRPDIVLAEGMGFRPGRVHEACGRSRRVLAAMLAGATGGPVIWAQPAWERDRLYPPGLAAFCDPGRIVIARVRTPAEALWVLEESLRSGAVGLAVAELADPPALTPVRRLHLAAETGAEAAHHAGRVAPLGLLLGAGDGRAQGVESRWHMAATPSPSGLLEEAGIAWRLERRRDRRAPVAAWSLLRHGRDEAGHGSGAGSGGGQITARPIATITSL